MKSRSQKQKKAIVIAVYNNKGGVGKTTFAINFARAISKRGQKILFVDNDGQANSSMILTGLTEDQIAEQVKLNIFDLMTDEDIKTDECIVDTKFTNIALIASTDDHNDTPDAISSSMDNTRILKEKLKEVEDKYDFMIIDCAPTRDRNIYNALFAAHIVITPIETQMFSQVGLRNLLKQITKVNKRRENPLLHYVFLSKVDNRQKTTNRRIRENLHTLLDDDFLESEISLLSLYVKSFEEGTTALDYHDNKGSIEVNKLTDMILNKINKELI